MDYITVKQCAELKGCSVQYVKKIVKDGKLQAMQEINPQNNKPQYCIPVSALPADLQARYYSEQKATAGVAPAIKAALKKPINSIKKAFEECSEDERKQIAFWNNILEDWQITRAKYENKTSVDPYFVGKVKLEHPDIDISTDILYRKLAAAKAQDFDGLIGKRGGWNRGNSSISDTIWQGFLYYYLDDNKPTVTSTYKNTMLWAEEFYPEMVANFPTERTFRRHIEKDLTKAVKVLMRDGEKAFNDRCLPYVGRLYDKLHVNDCWIADNHTLDIISINGDGQKHRLYITAFLDAKSGVLTGFNITEAPCAASTVLALRNGITKFGIPKAVYFDNGSEFLTHDVGGRGHRTRKNAVKDPPTILQNLGIEMHNALVRNARAKPIERTFGTVKNQFSRLFEGFCGGTILERKESLKRIIKNGELPSDLLLRDYMETWINGDYNLQDYGGNELKYDGKSRLDVWNEDSKSVSIRMADESTLNLMLMRSTHYQKIKRNGVSVTIFGEKLFYYNREAVRHIGDEVYVRYDPSDLSSVRIYDKDDKYLWTWKCADELMLEFLGAEKEEIQTAESIINGTRKFVKQEAKGLTAGLTSEQRITRLDMQVRKNIENRNMKFKIELPSNIIPVMPSDETVELAHAVGETQTVIIDINKMNKNGQKRKE